MKERERERRRGPPKAMLFPFDGSRALEEREGERIADNKGKQTLHPCSACVHICCNFASFSHSQIGLSVQHDASHGALSRSPAVNAFFSYGADWIGNSRWIWLQQVGFMARKVN